MMLLGAMFGTLLTSIKPLLLYLNQTALEIPAESFQASSGTSPAGL